MEAAALFTKGSRRTSMIVGDCVPSSPGNKTIHHRCAPCEREATITFNICAQELAYRRSVLRRRNNGRVRIQVETPFRRDLRSSRTPRERQKPESLGFAHHTNMRARQNEQTDNALRGPGSSALALLHHRRGGDRL
jgi:hypothetical protein